MLDIARITTKLQHLQKLQLLRLNLSARGEPITMSVKIDGSETTVTLDESCRDALQTTVVHGLAEVRDELCKLGIIVKD